MLPIACPSRVIHSKGDRLLLQALNLLGLYLTLPEVERRETLDRIEKLEESELDFVKSDMEKILESMQTGSDRIRQIILGLRNFSRLDEADNKKVDIHSGLDNTLLIVQHQLKSHSPEIAIVKKYGELPQIQCYANQLNQVFLNILSNAIDALTNSPALTPPEIRLTTELINGQTVRISMADNGPGMGEDIRNKVFDPFFTTKPVGQGTGLGLSTSYQIITEQHGGQLHCISEPGIGTEFVIEIPIELPGDRPN